MCFRSKTYLLFDTLINNLLKQLRTLQVPIWRNPRFDVFFYNGTVFQEKNIGEGFQTKLLDL